MSHHIEQSSFWHHVNGQSKSSFSLILFDLNNQIELTLFRVDADRLIRRLLLLFSDQLPLSLSSFALASKCAISLYSIQLRASKQW